MNRIARFSLVVVLLALIVPLAAVSAQDNAASRTVTLTEAQINSSYRVTNPARRGVTNVSVDLQPGMAVIASTHTIRSRGANTVYSCSSTWTPGITNGVVIWTLGGATCNGQPASAELTTQMNSHIGSSWRNYWRTQRGGRVVSVSVTDNEVIYTWQ
jgi:hypothetical protein